MSLFEQSPAFVGDAEFVFPPTLDEEYVGFLVIFETVGDGDWLEVTFNDEILWSGLGTDFEPGVAYEALIPSASLVGRAGLLQFTLQSVGQANAVVIIGDTAELEFIDDGEDLEPPVITCGGSDGAWHPDDVSVVCSATDLGSGLADIDDAEFLLSTAVPTGFETLDAATSSRSVCDVAGNCVIAGPVLGNMVDKKPPTIELAPAVPASLLLNQEATVLYSCSDAGSGVASCTGSAPNRGRLDTRQVGEHTVLVDARDSAGNASTLRERYVVSYSLCVLFDQTRSIRAGRTLPVKLQLCDAQNMNVSSPTIQVSAKSLAKVSNVATGAIEDSGQANPDLNFRFDSNLDGYIFNFSTSGLSTGNYRMTVSATGDPVEHSIYFQVR